MCLQVYTLLTYYKTGFMLTMLLMVIKYMASKRKAFYVELGGTSFGVIQLDPEIYDSSLSAILGVTSTAPTGNTNVFIPVTIRTLKKTGKAIVMKLKVAKGTGDAEKFRTIPVICETAKFASAIQSLANGSTETIKLGNLVTADWRIAGISG
jgi:hypothetical protein